MKSFYQRIRRAFSNFETAATYFGYLSRYSYTYTVGRYFKDIFGTFSSYLVIINVSLNEKCKPVLIDV